MDLQVFVKPVPTGPGRGTITLSPGDFTSSGTWSATEDQHDGDLLFSASQGTYSISNRIVTMLGPDFKTAVRLKDFGDGPSHGVGPGETFDAAGATSTNIAWRWLTPWPPDF